MISDTLSALIKRASKLEEEISDLEEIVSQRKGDLAQIMESDIPSVLHENGLMSAPLADGRTITIEQVVNCRQRDNEDVIPWAIEHGYDSIIKTEMDFGKGNDIEEIEAYLKAVGADYSKSTSIHAQTLKATMRRHMDAGGVIPEWVTVFERAKVKGGKE